MHIVFLNVCHLSDIRTTVLFHRVTSGVRTILQKLSANLKSVEPTILDQTS